MSRRTFVTTTLATATAAAASSGTPQPLATDDYESAARERIPHTIYEFIAAGAADEVTVRWNRASFLNYELLPHVLEDVKDLSTRCTLLGHDLPHPILLAPTAYHKLLHPDGERETARGAGEAEAVLVVSSSATMTIEEIAPAATSPLWFQIYLQPDRGFTREIVGRAEAAGCKALCLTVDSPVSGPQNRVNRAGFTLPPGLSAPMNPVSNRQRRVTGQREPFRARFPTTWKDVEWLLSFAKVPVVVKGILRADDADRAAKSGVAGLIVSNHGARNLDTAVATIDALPDVARSVAGRMPVLLDGGIRRGTDILKSLALGASAVLIGRPYMYALGVSGASGVAAVVNTLRSELEMAMALTGQTSLASLDPSIVRRRR